MNLFMLDCDVDTSCRMLAYRDPVRARCQLKEAVQVLAAVETLREGTTAMRTVAGERYKPTLAQLHHPVVLACLLSQAQHLLCYEIAATLAQRYPGHGSAMSLADWVVAACVPPLAPGAPGIYLAVRRGFAHKPCDAIDEYVDVMKPYLEAKWQQKPPKVRVVS